MIRFVVSAIVLGMLGACSSKDEPPPPPGPAPVVVRDADVDGIMEIGGYDPTSGLHLDDDGAGTPVNPTRRTHRAGTAIGIMLKSTPPGAVAAVDGVQQGKAPVYWSGEADGREHEFTFVLRGHAVARYRFVPIASGVVHATLEPVAAYHLDGGLAPVLSPSRPSDAAVAPPPTILTPADAARVLPDAAPALPASPERSGDRNGDAAPVPVPDPTGAGPQP